MYRNGRDSVNFKNHQLQQSSWLLSLLLLFSELQVMEVAYEYTRRRAEFGRPCNFSNGDTQLLESIFPTDAYDGNYIQRNPTSTLVDTTPHYSETEVNTERVVMKNTSMQHIEGGWPKDVDFTEQSDVKRFRKKVEKDEDYQYAMKTLIPRVQRCMKQNNTVNIYEEYFEGLEADHCSEPPFAKGLAVFRDPSQVTRTATSVNWHPEGSSNGRLAVSYAVLNFQDERLTYPNMSASVSHIYFFCSELRSSLSAWSCFLTNFGQSTIYCYSPTSGTSQIPTSLSSNLSHHRRCAAYDTTPKVPTLLLEGAAMEPSPTTTFENSPTGPPENASPSSAPL